MIIEDGKIRYAIEDKLAHKLDLMIDRCVREKGKQNAYLQNEGRTGTGKTNTSTVEAHYVKMKTGRDIHLFFRLESLIDFAKKTESKIIIWDEPSLDSLSTDQLTKLNRNLLRLINTSRKKRHFIIVNFTKFWKFPEDIVVDTCLGMVHTYVRGETGYGRFFYIRQKGLEPLWNEYKKTNKKMYAKYKSFGGVFPLLMEDYFDELDITIEGHPHCTYDDYEKYKDEAIESIGEENMKKDKNLLKLQELRYRVSLIPKIKNIPVAEIAAIVKTDRRKIQDWAKLNTTNQFS